jgi:hypothetical protein
MPFEGPALTRDPGRLKLWAYEAFGGAPTVTLRVRTHASMTAERRQPPPDVASSNDEPSGETRPRWSKPELAEKILFFRHGRHSSGRTGGAIRR